MNKSVAIMQPYAFPYLGYFSLIESSDFFVFLDDVSFIKRGWINRNRILLGKQIHRFSIPISNASQNRLICDTSLYDYDGFRRKFMRQVELAYQRAPYFRIGYGYIESSLNENTTSISDLAIRSIEEFYKLAQIETEFKRSSTSFPSTRGMEKSDRLIAITKQIGSSTYFNPAGGMSIYDKKYFSENGITLSFIKPRMTPYKHTNCKTFIEGLSIIDMLMNNDIETILKMANSYDIL